MDIQLSKQIIEHFDRNAFESFFMQLLNRSSNYMGQVRKLNNVDDRILECPPERYSQSADVFLLNYVPYGIFDNFTVKSLSTEPIKQLLNIYLKNMKFDLWLPIDGITIYVIDSFDSSRLGIKNEELLQYYERELSQQLPSTGYRVGTGNINTFLTETSHNAKELIPILQKFLSDNDEGLCISISNDNTAVSHFFSQNEFAGITPGSKTLVQPVYKRILSTNDILNEFNRLIFSDARESQLEDFLHTYYKQIFGNAYDRVSTQVWLRFPDLDIGQRERRLDVMMRNSNKDDWELFELKRANVELTKTISDVPMLVSAVNDAITQAKNYRRLLEQDKVKRALAADGIEYYEPEVNLVIGKKPAISNAQWRRLLADNQNGLKLITYDDLLKEAQNRYSGITQFLEF